MDKILFDYYELKEPLNFFKNWSEDNFKEWLYLDKYGLPVLLPEQKDLLSVLMVLEDYPEFDNFYKIVLKELQKIKELKSKKEL